MGFSLDLTPDDNDTNNIAGSNNGKGNYRFFGTEFSKEEVGMAFLTGGMSAGFSIADRTFNQGKGALWLQNSWEKISGKSARVANEKAAKEAERARRESIMKEMGAREQADSIAFGAAMRGANSNSPGMVGMGGEGTIGANLGTSGTF